MLRGVPVFVGRSLSQRWKSAQHGRRDGLGVRHALRAQEAGKQAQVVTVALDRARRVIVQREVVEVAPTKRSSHASAVVLVVVVMSPPDVAATPPRHRMRQHPQVQGPRPWPAARMLRAHRAFEVGHADLRVNLRRAQAPVPELPLHGEEIRAVADQVRRATVPPHVRRHAQAARMLRLFTRT